MLESFLNKYNGRIVYQNKIFKFLIILFSNGEEVLFKLENNNLKIISNKENNFYSSFSFKLKSP